MGFEGDLGVETRDAEEYVFEEVLGGGVDRRGVVVVEGGGCGPGGEGGMGGVDDRGGGGRLAGLAMEDGGDGVRVVGILLR